MDEKIYTVEEVAVYLRVDKRGIYELVRQGKIVVARIGKCIRISETALKEFVLKDS